MAKPFKNNAEYFSHDADMRNDVKVKALRRRFGHTGYAVWNYLLEVLTDADNFEIAYDALNRELYAADFDIPVEELDGILDYMETVGLIQRTDGLIFSLAHKQRLQAVSDRKLARAEAGRLGGIKSGESRRSKNEANPKQNEAMLQANPEIGKQIEPKESKVKESKEKESEVMAAKAASHAVPYDEIVRLWNSVCTAFPKVVKLTDGRRTKIRCRFEEIGGDLSSVEALFRRVQASSFLRGDNGHSWQANFDWLFENGQNWVKVTEGNYDNRGGYHPAQAFTQGQDGITLGVGEYIDPTGRRTYGTGQANIPPEAPPRPSERYYWSSTTGQWALL